MSFPVIIIFLVLLLWFVICLPLLELYYLESKLEGKLSKVYDMVILLSLRASIVMTFIIIVVTVFVCIGVL